MVSAMRAVEDDAMPLPLDHLFQYQLLLRPHDAIGAAVIAVGDDVARLHLGEDLRQRDRRIGDVDHQWHASDRRGTARHLDRLGGVFPDQPRPVAQFDADR